MASPRLRVAVFASGRGSNFLAILDAADRGDLDADVVLCLSDRDTAGALDRARAHGVSTVILAPSDFNDHASYTAAMRATLRESEANFIALAGYLKKVPTEIVEDFPHRIVNVHPALLPAFGGKGMYGRRVHEAVVEYGVHWSGATVHIVEEEYDTGPIVLQEPVPVYPQDSADDVSARVLEVEHRIYPAALQLFAQGRIVVEGRRVRILPPGSSKGDGEDPAPNERAERIRTPENS